MNRLTLSAATLVFLFVLLAATAAISAERAVQQRMGNDLFASGNEVRVVEPVQGDAILAGQRVTAEQRTSGDMVAAGNRVRLQGAVGGDLYAAGGEVHVAAPVSGSARLAGGRIEITAAAQIDDGVSIAGREVEIDGRIGPYAQIAAGSIRIGGHVAGDVNARGGSLTVSPGAVIDGALRFQGPNPPTVAEGAQIRDGVQHIQDESGGGRGLKSFFNFVGIVWMLGWLIVGILLLILAPGVTRAAVQTIRAQTWRSLMVGFVLLILVPAVIALVAITLIGIPLALVLIAAYLLLLAIGYLASVITISDSLLARLRGGKASTTAMRVGAFILVSVILYLLVQIPFAGGLIGFLVLLVGMGGLALLMFSRGRPPAPAQ